MNLLLKGLFIFVAISLSSCNDDFVDRPPYDAFPAENYYQTPEQIRSATGYLYANTWFDYIDKAASGFELMAGNATSGDAAIDRFSTFSLTPDYQQVIFPWRSFYGTIGRANVLISDLSAASPGPSVSAAILEAAIGEARFIRALSYFYLVQLWGDVPIIADNKAQVTNVLVPRAPIADVYRFIIEDLQYAEAHCPEKDQGRVTSFAAKALLAKAYLTRATLTKSGDDFNQAAAYAQEVMNSGTYRLLEDYAALWRTANDNNDESIFALQWVACGTSVQWGNNNSLQAYYAYNGEIAGVGDGWNMIQPSLDLLSTYEDGDLRRKATVMEDGNLYPEIHAKSGGLLYTKKDSNGAYRSGTGANVKKFIVGSSEDEEVCFMSTGLNTPLIRFADVLLTFAEAKLAGASTTGDPAALAALNAVRARAGLAPKEGAMSAMDILNERRVEFAIEFQFWFDVLRFHNLDPQGAIDYLGSQNRAGGIEEINGVETTTEVKFTPSENDFLLPIPSNDAAANPRLLEAPVPYYN